MYSYHEFKQVVLNLGDYQFVDIVDAIDDIFTKYNVEYLDQMEDIIMSNIDLSAQETIDILKHHLLGFIDYLVNLNKVQLNENIILLSQKVKILDALYEIDGYLDKSIMNDILDSDLNDEEKLCKLLSLVSNFDEYELLPLIESVDSSLLLVIKNLINQVNDLVGNQTNISEYVILYKKLKQYVQNKDLYADKFTSSVDTLGLPFISYLNLFIKEIPITLENIDNVALDMVSMLFISHVDDVYINIFRNTLSKISNVLDVTKALDKQVSKILIEVNNV